MGVGEEVGGLVSDLPMERRLTPGKTIMLVDDEGVGYRIVAVPAGTEIGVAAP